MSTSFNLSLFGLIIMVIVMFSQFQQGETGTGLGKPKRLTLHKSAVPRRPVISFAPDVRARIFEPDMKKEQEEESEGEGSNDRENLEIQPLDNQVKKKYKDILIERKHFKGDIKQRAEISKYLKTLEEEASVKINDNPLEAPMEEEEEKDMNDKNSEVPNEQLNKGNIDFPVRDILKKNEKWAKKLEKQKETEMKILTNCEKVDMKGLKKKIMNILQKYNYLKEHIENPRKLNELISELDKYINEEKNEILYWSDNDEDYYDGTYSKIKAMEEEDQSKLLQTLKKFSKNSAYKTVMKVKEICAERLDQFKGEEAKTAKRFCNICVHSIDHAFVVNPNAAENLSCKIH